ncbi:hypothetical protein G9A89_018273 [Geosiphon pyriformis]|nr:hypothetical protein G9A89_018273 [Geosiphon pyriformis]
MELSTLLRANTNPQFNRALCYQNGWGTTNDVEKAFELYLKAAEAGDIIAQKNLVWCYLNGRETTKNEEKAFELYSKAGDAGNKNSQYNLGWCYQNGWGTIKNVMKALELYLKAEANNLSYNSNTFQFQKRGLKFPDNSKEEFLDSEAFFNQLSDECKCLKCGNLGIIISGSPICLFGILTKVMKVYLTPACRNIWRRWNSGNENIDQYIGYTQQISESCRGCLEWISPDEILSLDQVGIGGFSVVKEGIWERGKILFLDEKNQNYERIEVTRVVFKHLKNSQKMEKIHTNEVFSFKKSIYILECYGMIKDLTTDEVVMILPFAEHGDLRAFLKNNKNIFTWNNFSSGLRFIHESGLHGDLNLGNILVLKSNPLKVVISDLGFCHPTNYSPEFEKIFGIVQYLAPKICSLSPHTRYSDVYSFAIITWEIISGERPWKDVKKQSDVIGGRRPIIEKHTSQSWRDSAKKLQEKVIAARENCNLEGLVREKRSNCEEAHGYKHDITRYTFFRSGIFHYLKFLVHRFTDENLNEETVLCNHFFGYSDLKNGYFINVISDHH